MWYDTGTVAVANGSTIVTGTGTNFISGAQIGEAFLAPDDKLYEIQSITSATTLVLADSYLGSTQSGQNYKIIPTQSLVADLASQVTDLITDYSNVKDTAGAGKFNDGTVTAPAITFEQDQNNGLYRIGSDNWGMSAGGQKQVDISTTDVELNYSGSKKLATTATGVDVTGTITADGLDVRNTSSPARIKVQRDDNTNSADAASIDLLEGTGINADFGVLGSFGYRLEVDGATNKFNIKSGNGASVTNRLSIDRDSGDVSFYEDTGTTAKFVWDASAESLGIGTASPATELHIVANANGETAQLTIDGSTTTYNAKARLGSFNDTLYLTNNYYYASGQFGDTTSIGSASLELGNGVVDIGTAPAGTVTPLKRMTIDSAGNVGIGTASPDSKLEVVGGVTVGSFSGNGYRISRSGSSLPIIEFGTLSADVLSVINPVNSPLVFGTNNTERARIDSSGNLLVNTTSTAPAGGNVNGSALLQYGGASMSRTNTPAIDLNRSTSDGSIATFRKDGTTVGSISSRSGNFALESGDVGLHINNGIDSFYPSNGTGSVKNGAVDLGFSGARFKDLYLSGGVYLGGTDAVNKLDDYEEGTYTPTLTSISGGSATYTSRGSYTKIGNKVTVWFSIQVDTYSHTTGNVAITMPFTNTVVGSTNSAGSVDRNNSSNSNVSCLTFFSTNALAQFTTKGGSYLQANEISVGTLFSGVATYETNA